MDNSDVPFILFEVGASPVCSNMNLQCPPKVHVLIMAWSLPDSTFMRHLAKRLWDGAEWKRDEAIGDGKLGRGRACVLLKGILELVPFLLVFGSTRVNTTTHSLPSCAVSLQLTTIPKAVGSTDHRLNPLSPTRPSLLSS